MFNKKEEKLDSLIGVNCSFEGQIDTKGAIRIDGSIKGNVEADWIIIGADAKVQGDLSGKNILVGGIVTGNILARENLEIRQTGRESMNDSCRSMRGSTSRTKEKPGSRKIPANVNSACRALLSVMCPQVKK